MVFILLGLLPRSRRLISGILLGQPRGNASPSAGQLPPPGQSHPGFCWAPCSAGGAGMKAATGSDGAGHAASCHVEVWGTERRN